jgi:D-aspartate ligase
MRYDVSVPAVVVGADINGLGVVRSLARERVPIYLATRTWSDSSIWTRFGTKVLFRSLSGPVVIDELLELRRRFGVDPVLFLTQEDTVEAVSTALDRIQASYKISMPEASLMARLMNKAEFQMLAQERGFPIPRAIYIRKECDLSLADSLTYPCVFKPIVKTPAYTAHFKKAYKVGSAAELRTIFLGIDGTADMIAQEWIEGGDDHIYFCLQYRSKLGGAPISFVGRKLRSWPPQTGGTASCVPALQHEEVLTRLTGDFFDAVGFFGIGSMEFKRDMRTGRFMMIEPTVGRTDFQEEVATLNGVNIPYAAYRDELGLERSATKAVHHPAGWVVSDIDRWSSELLPALRGFPQGVRRFDAIWRFDDPLPWCAAVAKKVRSALSNLMRRLFGRG